MKFISWNVNGLRACVQKGFIEYFNEMDADFFCLIWHGSKGKNVENFL